MPPRLCNLFPAIRRHPGRVVLAGALLALLTWGATALARNQYARRHFQQAQQALERNDLDRAQEHLEQCLSVWNDRAPIQLLAAQTARRRDAFEDADRHLTECERLTGKTEETNLERELLIAQQGEPDLVVEHLRSVALQRPSLAVPIWEAVTRGCLNSYSKSDALDCANLLLQRAPDHAGGLLLRGKALESLKRDEGALHDYRRAVELDPAGDEARLRLAALYARLGRPWQALPHYQCLAEGQPDNREVLLGLARCHYDLHALKEARLTLNRLIDRHPDYVPALVQRGRWDFHAGRTAEAESALRRATELDARDHDAHITLCQCLETQGKEKEAQLFQARLRRLEDDNTRVRVLIDWSRHHPHDAPLRYEIGTRLVALGRDEDAASWFFAALGEDAHYAPAHTALAEYFEHTGRPFRAARQRRAAQDPGR